MAKRRAWGGLERRGKKWYARVRVAGVRTRRLLKDEDGVPVRTHAAAETALKELRADLEERSEILGGERARLRAWLDHEYDELLQGRLTERSAAMARTYALRFADWVVEERGDVYLHEVTRGDAELYCARFVAEGYKASYLRRHVNVLRKAWSDAITRGLATENIWSKAPVPRIAETVVPWIAPADLVRLCDAVTPTQRGVVTLLAETGLRVGEALALRPEDVDLDGARLHVRGGKTRAAKRDVPLTPRAIAVLRRAIDEDRDDGLVFADRWSYTTLQALKTGCRHARLPELTLHQLRHVYASHLVVSGCPPTVVAALLGHADGGALVLRLYGRWFPNDAQARAVQAMDLFRSSSASATS